MASRLQQSSSPSCRNSSAGHDDSFYSVNGRQVPRSLSLDHACASDNIIASLPVRSASVSTAHSGRRLARKLPPAWTESLEHLARYPPVQASTPTATGHKFDSSQTMSCQSHNPNGSYFQYGVSPMSHTVSLPDISETSSSEKTRQKANGKMIDHHTSRRFVLDVAPPVPPKDDLDFTRPSRLVAVNEHNTPTIPARTTRLPSVASSSSSHNLSDHTANPKSHTDNTRLRKSPSSRSDILMTPHQSTSKLPISHKPRSSTDSRSSANRSSSSGGPGGGAWSIFDEVQMADNLSIRSAKIKKESRVEKKDRVQREKQLFDEDTPPSQRQLFEASLMEVVDEHGQTISFGDLVRNRRTIVVFIRHWFCPLCAQYMNSILAEVSPDALEEAGVDLIIIGNGSDKMLDGYRNKAFRCPFKMYTDRTLALYRALGLTRQTGDSGLEEDKGDYLVQTAMQSTVQTIKRATKMPLRNPGHFTQLGGEFIFDGTLNVTYTHRMSNTRSHAPIRDICAEAGVRLEFIHYEPGPPPPPVHRRSYLGIIGTGHAQPPGESVSARHGTLLDTWQQDRDATLRRMKALKEARRGGVKLLDARSRVPPIENVRIVGQDLEEVQVVHSFRSLGIAV